MKSRPAESKMDNDFLPVLVIGLTGAGKSTLINYLLGKKLVRAKEVGLFKMDVAGGNAKPAICHKILSSGTKELGEFKDEIKRITYYDTPPLNGFYDKHSHKAVTNISQVSQLIDQIKEKKGVVIVVISVSELDKPHYGLIPLLDTLSEKTKTADCHILFAATKTAESTTPTNGY
jgi:predicted GTPase